jgi:hypothetical protein
MIVISWGSCRVSSTRCAGEDAPPAPIHPRSHATWSNALRMAAGSTPPVGVSPTVKTTIKLSRAGCSLSARSALENSITPGRRDSAAPLIVSTDAVLVAGWSVQGRKDFARK